MTVNACIRKVRYEDKWKAEGAVKRTRKRAKADIFVYRCDICQGWHLTKMAPEITTE